MTNLRLGPLSGSVMLLAAMSALGLGGCGSQGKPSRTEATAVEAREQTEQLASWLEGNFSSQVQSQADPAYFDIRLHMRRIWSDRADGPWLYVEQARADLVDKPYRQRVYHLRADRKGQLMSEVYTLPEPVARFTGAWNELGGGTAFQTIKPEQLRFLDGCTISLTWDPAGRRYTGGTMGTGCASTREGAKYTTSQVDLREDRLISLDRGFDASGKQVWGATGGGYEFIKQR